MRIVNKLSEGVEPLELTNEIIEALKKLGEAILVVRTRLLSEGYTIVDGKYVPPKKSEK